MLPMLQGFPNRTRNEETLSSDRFRSNLLSAKTIFVQHSKQISLDETLLSDFAAIAYKSRFFNNLLIFDENLN